MSANKILCIVVVLLLAWPAQAERRYLKKSEVFCDSSETVCLDGTLYYETNSRVLTLKARLQKKVAPGIIRLRFTGTDRHDYQSRTEILLRIRGNYSEIVTTRMRPDDPAVSNWQLVDFTFEPTDD